MPVITDDQIISLHTADRNVQLGQFLAHHYTDSTWSRRLRDAGSATVTLPPQEGLAKLPEIIEWAHWISIYDGERNTLLWTGPIQKLAKNRRGLTLDAKDSGAYLGRTRNPITKRWEATDPSFIAGELFEQMVRVQGLNVNPIVRPDPEGERFDFQVVIDEAMLDTTMRDLVNLGLRWSVVSGVPVVGPPSIKPVATLSEDDFLGDGITFVRDGSAVFNDVLVRGPVTFGRSRVDYHGQNLQTISNLDSMFAVGSIQRAADQFVRHSSSTRTRLELSGGTALHPDAPVHIDELMPGARFVIEAGGISQTMELTSVEVERRAGSAHPKITLESLPDRDPYGNLIELDQAQNQGQPVVTLGGQGMTR